MLNALGTNEIKVLMKLEALRLEFFALRETLSRWVSRQTLAFERRWHTAADSRDSKLRAMRAIIRSCARNRECGCRPSYMAPCGSRRSLGELPPVVADFSHVGRVIMDGVMPHAGLNNFCATSASCAACH
jgi:hypothetical protein